MIKNIALSVFASIAFLATSFAQLSNPNYDEAKIKSYVLPEVLKMPDGKKVITVKQWEQTQRPHLLNLFKENMFGKMPGKPSKVSYEVLEQSATVLNGKAIRKQIKLNFGNGAAMMLLLYLPKSPQQSVVFAGLNFRGNTAVNADKSILPSLFIDTANSGLSKEEFVEANRGSAASRWPISEIIDAGFGLATAGYEDLERDDSTGWKYGIRHLLKDDLQIKPHDWTAIGAWAWGLSRIQDYLETLPEVDAKKTIVFGHSRLGKTALWAGATDQRFAKIIANESGEGGAALARRNFGETTKIINTAFPHWFMEKYKTYNDHADLMPFDQHMLIALQAPRPVYVASAEKDEWADPKGEMLGLFHADPVYNLYGLKGLGTNKMPSVNSPVSGQHNRYHIRTGKHDVLLYDWQQYLDFAKHKE